MLRPHPVQAALRSHEVSDFDLGHEERAWKGPELLSLERFQSGHKNPNPTNGHCELKPTISVLYLHSHVHVGHSGALILLKDSRGFIVTAQGTANMLFCPWMRLAHSARHHQLEPVCLCVFVRVCVYNNTGCVDFIMCTKANYDS